MSLDVTAEIGKPIGRSPADLASAYSVILMEGKYLIHKPCFSSSSSSCLFACLFGEERND